MGQILDINTTPPEYTILIDGETFAFSAPEEFEYKEFLWMQTIGKKFDRMSKKDYTETIGSELETMLDTVTKKILPGIPDNIFEKLKDMQKIAIISKFNELSNPDKEDSDDGEQSNSEAD